jgi:hypothetical protein
VQLHHGSRLLIPFSAIRIHHRRLARLWRTLKETASGNTLANEALVARVLFLLEWTWTGRLGAHLGSIVTRALIRMQSQLGTQGGSM